MFQKIEKKGTGTFGTCPLFLGILLFNLLFLFVSPFVFPQPTPELLAPISSDRAAHSMVVTAHPYATQAALEILQAGGNAADAAIAAQWVLNVVEPQSSGIGGGGFFLYFDSKTQGIYAFDGRERAPARAYPEMFLDSQGDPIPFYPDRITGGLSVGVPGTLKLLKRVHDRFGSGKFRFEQLFTSAIQFAKEGAPVSKRLAEAIQEESDRLILFEASRKIFFHPNGEPLKEGETLFQKDLAKTFKILVREGIGAFYEGEIGRALIETVQKAPFHPGLLEFSDLQFYEVIEREALYGNYRGYDIFTMGPPSSGGVALLEILNILENFSLVFYGPSADSFHLAIEAQKLAFEDRAHFLGDPDFVKIPLERLLSKDTAKKKAKEIKFDEARAVESLVDEATSPTVGNTSHLSIRDREGNLVSYTTTIEHVFGSAMVVPGWGFLLNNELTDFDARPRIPSPLMNSVAPKGHLLRSALPKVVTGKLKPNAPGPEKRPRSSMCPTLIFRNGQPYLVVGSPGGSLIIPTVQEMVMYSIDFRIPPEQALASPRFVARGDRVEAEADFFDSPGIVQELKNRGHNLVLRKSFGNAQAIFFEKNGESFIGVSDPRGEGEARGD